LRVLIVIVLEFIIMSKNVSQKQKVLNFLNKTEGYNTLTAAQAKSRFGIKNMSALIDVLRQEGNVIYTNTRSRADGSKVKSYRIGKPTKALVRAAYEAGFAQ
jgi:hypothetical protein